MRLLRPHERSYAGCCTDAIGRAGPPRMDFTRRSANRTLFAQKLPSSFIHLVWMFSRGAITSTRNSGLKCRNKCHRAQSHVGLAHTDFVGEISDVLPFQNVVDRNGSLKLFFGSTALRQCWRRNRGAAGRPRGRSRLHLLLNRLCPASETTPRTTPGTRPLAGSRSALSRSRSSTAIRNCVLQSLRLLRVFTERILVQSFAAHRPSVGRRAPSRSVRPGCRRSSFHPLECATEVDQESRTSGRTGDTRQRGPLPAVERLAHVSLKLAE